MKVKFPLAAQKKKKKENKIENGFKSPTIKNGNKMFIT